MARRARVGDVMQSEVATLAEGDRLDLVEDIMRLGRIRHMPVVEGRRLVGIVSNRDLLAASLSRALDFDAQEKRAFLRSVEVKEVMTADVRTVEPDTPLAEAAARMLDAKVGCLPVVERDGSLVGLLTESDLVRAAYLEPGAADAEEAPAGEAAREETSDRLHEELERVRRLRDELRVRAHLARAEARDLWEDLERRFREVEARVKETARRAGEPAHDVREALENVLSELRKGYQRVRDAL